MRCLQLLKLLSVESHGSYCLQVTKPCPQHGGFEEHKVHEANTEKNWHHALGMLDDSLAHVTSQ